MDVVWTAEFAANGVVDALPEGAVRHRARSCRRPSTAPPTSTSCTPSPMHSDGGLLYYRKDLLEEARRGAAEDLDRDEGRLRQDQGQSGNEKLDCYAGQHDKYEGRTVNFAEAVNSAGGVIVGDDGKPNVNTPEAKKGLRPCRRGSRTAPFPRALSPGRKSTAGTAFQNGTLIFHRNWGYVYARATRTTPRPRSRASSTSPRYPGSTVRASPAWAGTTSRSPSTARTRAPRWSLPSGGPARKR